MINSLQDILNELSPLANETTQRIYTKQGIQEKILGINKGPLRKLALKIKTNHKLGLELWESNIFEARIISSMILDPAQLDITSLGNLIKQSTSTMVIDELTFEVFESIKDPKTYIDQWMDHPDLRLQRSAWNMAIVLIHRKKLPDQEMEDLYTIIEEKLLSTEPIVQYEMNRCLCEIGITHPKFTERCLALGERLGLYKEIKVSKGCTSPYAPDWINAVLRRNA